MVRTVVCSILYLFGFGENPLSKRNSEAKRLSDFDAIKPDWQNIGMDIYNAMQKYEQQENPIKSIE